MLGEAAWVWVGLAVVLLVAFGPLYDAHGGGWVGGVSRTYVPPPFHRKLLFVSAALLPFAMFGTSCLRQPRRRLAAEVALALGAAPVPALLLFGCVLRVVDLETVAWGPRTLLSPTAGAAGLALVVAWGALLAWRELSPRTSHASRTDCRGAASAPCSRRRRVVHEPARCGPSTGRSELAHRRERSASKRARSLRPYNHLITPFGGRSLEDRPDLRALCVLPSRPLREVREVPLGAIGADQRSTIRGRTTMVTSSPASPPSAA